MIPHEAPTARAWSPFDEAENSAQKSATEQVFAISEEIGERTDCKSRNDLGERKLIQSLG
jgi:hypothetical protein